MGFDAEYAPLEMNDTDIVRVCHESGRILITRDRELARRTPNSVLIGSQDHREQARQFVSIHPPDPEKMFSRCTECNGVLMRIRVTPELNLPAGVVARFDTVYRCDFCGKMYWEGDHYHDILKSLSAMGVIDADRTKR